jgi:AraC-like DNA-binding protein
MPFYNIESVKSPHRRASQLIRRSRRDKCWIGHVHALAQRRGGIDWAQIALECGFFDQSHLVNEFRAISGLTPSTYQRDLAETRNLLSGHVAVH